MTRPDTNVLRALAEVSNSAVVMEWLKSSLDGEVKTLLQNPPDANVRIGRAQVLKELADTISNARENLEKSLSQERQQAQRR